MLIFSETRYNPVSVNMITLKNEHGYFHVHRSLYDNAVILYDLYNNNQASLRSMLMTSVSRPEVAFFYDNVPAPLNILGYFLDLINGPGALGEDLETLCGAIHVMSMSLDFRQLLKVDTKLRQSIRFSLSIKEEYQVLWDRFFAESSPFGASAPVAIQPQVMYDTYSTPAPAPEATAEEETEEEADIGEDEFLFDDEPEDFAAIAAALQAEKEEEEAQEQNNAPMTPAPAPAFTVPEPAPVEAPKASDSGLNLVKSWV